jgi:uncharacterized protein (TIGR02594 family)
MVRHDPTIQPIKVLLDRRTVLVGAAALTVSAAARAQRDRDWGALAVEDTAVPLIPPELQSYADQPSLNETVTGYQPFGTHPPTDEEKKVASQVLAKVPTNCAPIEVALYFLDVGAGKYGAELRPYVTAWPVDWNPVIVQFFTEIHSQPSGDTTAWCAAFMNFCLLRAAVGKTLPPGSAEPTLSAASSTFRYWSRELKEPGDVPKQGDVAVFRNKQSPAYGHVGFFLAQDAMRVLVLGGNQFEGTPIRHTINRKWIAKNGGALQLHSYRTDPQLHV